jgi:hypothetical protein
VIVEEDSHAAVRVATLTVEGEAVVVLDGRVRGSDLILLLRHVLVRDTLGFVGDEHRESEDEGCKKAANKRSQNVGE